MQLKSWNENWNIGYGDRIAVKWVDWNGRTAFGIALYRTLAVCLGYVFTRIWITRGLNCFVVA